LGHELSWIVTCATGATMLVAGMRKKMLDRPRRRRCRSCGRFSGNGCRCAKH
jgi:hypothetical protein